MAVYVHHHHFYKLLNFSFFTLGSKPIFFTSLSHHELLVPYHWTAFSYLLCSLVCCLFYFPIIISFLVSDPVWYTTLAIRQFFFDWTLNSLLRLIDIDIDS